MGEKKESTSASISDSGLPEPKSVAELYDEVKSIEQALDICIPNAPTLSKCRAALQQVDDVEQKRLFGNGN